MENLPGISISLKGNSYPFYKGTAFGTSCLLSGTKIPLLKNVLYEERICKFLPVREHSFTERKKINFEELPPLESVYICLKKDP